MLHMVLPKGTSFEFLTQLDVNLIVNHINSTPREILSGRTPYEGKRQTMRQSLKSTPPIIGDVASCIRPEDYLTMA